MTVGDAYTTSALHYTVQGAVQNRNYVPILQYMVKAVKMHNKAITESEKMGHEVTAAVATQGVLEGIGELINIDVRDADERTPLMYAIIGSQSLSSESVSASASESATPVTELAEHVSSLQNAQNVILELLDAGADPTLTDSFGISAIAMVPLERQELRELLANAAADMKLKQYEHFTENKPPLDTERDWEL